jgi:hypothetical protein
LARIASTWPTPAAIEKAVKPLKEAAQQAGQSEDGQAGGRGKKKNLTGNSRKVLRDRKAEESRTTGAVAAVAVGMDRRT